MVRVHAGPCASCSRSAAIAYRAIELDSVAYQHDNCGTGRSAPRSPSTAASPTIPQIFVGGQLIGGASETLDAFAQGRLQELLNKPAYRSDAVGDKVYSLMPGWVQPSSKV